MNIKIRTFPKHEILIGFGLEISNIVSSKEMMNYSKNKEYPKMYTVKLGLLFVIIEFNIKGGN